MNLCHSLNVKTMAAEKLKPNKRKSDEMPDGIISFCARAMTKSTGLSVKVMHKTQNFQNMLIEFHQTWQNYHFHGTPKNEHL